MQIAWLLSLPILFLLLSLSIVCRQAHGSWLAPGPFFAAAWSMLVLLPMLLASEFYVWWGAVAAIVCAVLAVNVGSLAATASAGTVSLDHGNTEKIALKLTKPLSALTVLATISGMLSVLLVMRDLGQQFQTLFFFEDLVAAAAENSILRYQQDYVPPYVARVLTTGVYLAPLIGGTLYAVGHSRVTRILSYAPLIPAMLWTVVMTTKASILLAAILWIASYFAASIWANSGATTWTLRGIISKSLVLSVVLGGLLILTQMSRYGKIDAAAALFVLAVLKTAFLGYLAALSVWISDYLSQPLSATLGVYTFAGVFDMLGIASRQLGLYGEQLVEVGDSTTNVYTIFRSLIQDFTAIGALLIMGGFGYLTGLAFVSLRSGNVVGIAYVGLFYAVLLWSHVTSLFAYNTIVLAFGLWWGVLVFLRRIYCS